MKSSENIEDKNINWLKDSEKLYESLLNSAEKIDSKILENHRKTIKEAIQLKATKELIHTPDPEPTGKIVIIYMIETAYNQSKNILTQKKTIYALKLFDKIDDINIYDFYKDLHYGLDHVIDQWDTSTVKGRDHRYEWDPESVLLRVPVLVVREPVKKKKD